MTGILMGAQRFLVAALLILSGVVNAQDAQEPMIGKEAGASDDCHNACTALVTALGPSKAFYNSVPEGFTESYYCARQTGINPACILQPSSPEDVSTAIQIINQHSCYFAVKSGGHAMFEGASNSDGGVTIDLRYLNTTQLSEDEKTLRVGPGNRWSEVYSVLEPKGLTVVGGRASSVGVGGFMLGGGISFTSRMYGWASDNVRNYEVVLANGSISNINYASHPDLFWALRGGGNNFGVVTRFDLETFHQGPVWGGHAFYVFSDIPSRLARLNIKRSINFSKTAVTQAISRLGIRLVCLIGRCTTTTTYFDVLEKMANKGEDDVPYMHLYMSIVYIPEWDLLWGSSCAVHSEPVANPPAFKDFESLQHAKSLASVRNLTSIMGEVDPYNVPGYRNMYASMTFKPNAELLSKILDFFMEEVETIRDVPGLTPIFVLQPISKIASAGSHKNGGTPFGIKPEDGPLVMLLVSPKWDKAEDDKAVQAAFARLMDRSVALAKEMNLHHRWIYQNYGNISQDVFAGYGDENRQKLLDIQGKYDPERMFAKLQPGYFKL